MCFFVLTAKGLVHDMGHMLRMPGKCRREEVPDGNDVESFGIGSHVQT